METLWMTIGLNWETNYQYILNEKFYFILFFRLSLFKKKNQNIIKLGNQVA